MKTLVETLVRTTSANYPVYYSSGKIASILKDIKKVYKNRPIVVVSESRVAALYKEKFLSNFSTDTCHFVTFPAGEKNKNRRVKEKVEDQLLEKNLPRNTLLIALGGGVCGDLAGYIAATYLRGIDFIQIPTTLLSMVDSSVGGKTGVDTRHGKNLIGAFHQPKAVYIDLNFLDTLSEKEFFSGLAEVIKYGFIEDKKIYDYLVKNREIIMQRDPEALLTLVKRSVASKARVVRQDEKETLGVRKILNFGHTAGHAVEHLMNYKRPHGHCIALGMAFESLLAATQKVSSVTVHQDIVELLNYFQYDLSLPGSISFEAFYTAMLSDKKNVKGAVHFTLPKAVAAMAFDKKGFSKAYSKEVLKAVYFQYKAAFSD